MISPHRTPGISGADEPAVEGVQDRSAVHLAFSRGKFSLGGAPATESVTQSSLSNEVGSLLISGLRWRL